jgi:hypothetical protein
MFSFSKFLCSTCGRFFVPTRRYLNAPRAAAVKAGRRSARAETSILNRPRLDGGEHGARVEASGQPKSRNQQQNVLILDWAEQACGEHRITLYPVGHKARIPNPSCMGEGKAQ